MNYKKHAVVNTILGTLALKIADLPVIFSTLSPAVLAGFLVDVDHYLYHVWKLHTFSLRKLKPLFYEDFNTHRQRFYPFHTLEFGVIFTILVYYTPMTWPWAFGYWVHLSSDAVYNYRLRGNVSSWFPRWIGTLHGYRRLQARRESRRQRLAKY